MNKKQYCPFTAGLECWEYTPKCLEGLSQDVYFAGADHNWCTKLNAHEIGKVRAGTPGIRKTPMPEEQDRIDDTIAYLMGSPLTEQERAKNREGRTNDMLKEITDSFEV